MGRTGIRISFLASLLVAGAGCGSVKDSGAVDASNGEAGIDADESGNVTVSTKAFVQGQTVGAAVADVDLVSTLPNGTILATAKTDAAGAGTIKVVPGGAVTAVYKRLAPSLASELVTIVGVKPGETLDFGNRQIGVASTAIGAQSYSWPTAPNGAVQTYRAMSACNSNTVAAPTTSTSFSEFSDCNKSTMDVVYAAYQNVANGLLHCGTRQNVTFVNGANVALGGWQNAGTFIANITGLPASLGLPNASVSTALRTIVDGQSIIFMPNAGSASGVASGGAFTGNMQWCNAGERTQAQLTLSRPGVNAIRVVDSLPSNATSWTVAAPMVPPWVEFDFFASASQGVARWGFVTEGTNTMDVVYAQLGYEVRINNMQFFTNWHFILPPNSDSLTVPKLPAALAETAPTTDFGLFLQRVIAIEVPTISSYDMIRSMGTANVLCPDCAVRAGDIQRAIISGQ
jgi:hypothetical protein